MNSCLLETLKTNKKTKNLTQLLINNKKNFYL
jgi:hypothetical protein